MLTKRVIISFEVDSDRILFTCIDFSCNRRMDIYVSNGDIEGDDAFSITEDGERVSISRWQANSIINGALADADEVVFSRPL